MRIITLSEDTRLRIPGPKGFDVISVADLTDEVEVISNKLFNTKIHEVTPSQEEETYKLTARIPNTSMYCSIRVGIQSPQPFIFLFLKSTADIDIHNNRVSFMIPCIEKIINTVHELVNEFDGLISNNNDCNENCYSYHRVFVELGIREDVNDFIDRLLLISVEIDLYYAEIHCLTSNMQCFRSFKLRRAMFPDFDAQMKVSSSFSVVLKLVSNYIGHWLGDGLSPNTRLTTIDYPEMFNKFSPMVKKLNKIIELTNADTEKKKLKIPSYPLNSPGKMWEYKKNIVRKAKDFPLYGKLKLSTYYHGYTTSIVNNKLVQSTKPLYLLSVTRETKRGNAPVNYLQVLFRDLGILNHKEGGIPEALFNADRETKLSFIAGFIAAEGTKMTTGYNVVQGQKNLRVLTDLRKLCLMLNMGVTSIWHHGNDVYRMTISQGFYGLSDYMLLDRKKFTGKISPVKDLTFEFHPLKEKTSVRSIVLEDGCYLHTEGGSFV